MVLTLRKFLTQNYILEETNTRRSVISYNSAKGSNELIRKLDKIR